MTCLKSPFVVLRPAFSKPCMDNTCAYYELPDLMMHLIGFLRCMRNSVSRYF